MTTLAVFTAHAYFLSQHQGLTGILRRMDVSDAQDDGTEIGEDDIVAHVFEAIVEQRLPPGTKLSESALCEAFGVGRMRVRRCLLLLASREIVELRANRGAYVAAPSAQQAHEVFEARLALEPTIARLVVERAGDGDIAVLAHHLRQEHEAHHAGRRRDAIRLSGQFHSVLAQIAGNSVMQRMMNELITRTSLIIGIFGAPGMASCRDDDHERIVQAIRDRDSALAAQVMRDHLREIQAHLDLKGRAQAPLDVVSILKR